MPTAPSEVLRAASVRADSYPGHPVRCGTYELVSGPTYGCYRLKLVGAPRRSWGRAGQAYDDTVSGPVALNVKDDP